MKSFYAFSTSEYSPVSLKNRYMSDYYDQAKSLLKTQFNSPALTGLLAKENRIGKTVQWQTSFFGEFKRISEFDEQTQAYLSDKFCMLRDQILNFFEEKSKHQKGGNAGEWKEIFTQIFNPTNLIIFSNGEDISIVWGWALMNNENYLPFLNYTKKIESVPIPDPIEPNNEGDETDSGTDEQNIDEGNDIVTTGIEVDPIDENEEPIEIVLDEEEKKEEKIEEIVEEDESSEEIEETPVKPIDDEPEKPASNWFFAFLNWLERIFKRFWWLILLILLLLLLLFLFKKCDHFGAASGNETAETRKREELKKILPKEPRKRPVIDTTKIIKGEDSTEIIGNVVNIALKDKTKKFEDFVLDLKKAFPSKDYKVVYYDNETNRVQFQFPDSLQATIKNDLRTKLKSYPLLIWDEQLFRSSKSFNDPVFSDKMKSWHLDFVGASKAWDITTGKKDVIVAIIDDGFDLNHKDLQNNITKPYNVITKTSKVVGRPKKQMHGTHVSGIAIGKANNNFGITGIAPGCSFMPIQASPYGEVFSSTDIIDAVLYAIKNGADVINMSLGLPAPPFFNNRPDSFMENWIRTKNKDIEVFWNEVFTYAEKENVTIVLSAGNGTADLHLPVLIGFDPKNRSNKAINVSAVDPKNNKTSFSDYGPLSHVSAPGFNIYSSVPENNFIMESGTSMAAPIVTGAVALMKSINPKLTNTQIKEILRKTGKRSSDIRIGPVIQIDKALMEVKKMK